MTAACQWKDTGDGRYRCLHCDGPTVPKRSWRRCRGQGTGPHIPHPKQLPPSGPGTELKTMLGKLGIKPQGGCGCESYAAEMDKNGVEWCEQNVDTIVGRMRKEAEKRKLPFVDAAGRMLVKRAIKKARKKEENHG